MKNKIKNGDVKHRKILCVTDQHDLMRFVEDTFVPHSNSITYRHAMSGEDGIKIAKKMKPDVVLMDLSLHSLSGIDAARQIKTDIPECKIVMISMYMCDCYPAGL